MLKITNHFVGYSLGFQIILKSEFFFMYLVVLQKMFINWYVVAFNRLITFYIELQ